MHLRLLTCLPMPPVPPCAASLIQQGILDQRLQETAENWRLVYKSLLLLEYMVKHGPLVSTDGERGTHSRQ